MRQQSLDRCDWQRDGSERLALQYVEAWRYEGVSGVRQDCSARRLIIVQDKQADTSNFALGSLSSETELQNWLARKSLPSAQQRNSKLLGALRLVVCDRTKYTPLDFPLSQQAFESIERTFDLSPMTVIALESEPGTYSRFLIRANDDRSKMRRIRKYNISW